MNEVTILVKAKDLTRDGFGSASDGASRMGSHIGGVMKGLAASVAAGFAVDKIVSWGSSLIHAAEESAQVTAQTNAVIKSMGSDAGISAAAVAELSESLAKKTGIDDELIQSGTNVLRTFGNIADQAGEGNDIFTRGTKAALDMSVALGSDLSGANIQLGKALNDPVKGITALTRSGVSFTQQQKDQISAMAESGDLLGAQKLLIGEVERQFAGSAEAQATASGKLSVAWGNLQEKLGEKLQPVMEKFASFATSRVIPAVEAVAGGVQAFIQVFQHAEDGTTSSGFAGGMERLAIKAREVFDQIAAKVREWWPKIKEGFDRVREVVTQVVATVREHWPEIQSIITDVIATVVSIVSGAVNLIVTLWDNFGNNILDLVARIWPRIEQIIHGALEVIRGVVAFIVALIHGDWAGAWEAIQQVVRGAWELIQGIVGGALELLRAVVGIGLEILGSVFKSAWEGISNGATAVKDWVIARLGELVDWFSRLPGMIADIASGMWNGLTSGLADAVNWALGKVEDMVNGIIDAYNRLPLLGNISHVSLPRVGGSPQGVGGTGGGIIPIRGAHAAGGIAGGLSRLHEQGSELVKLPEGTMVYGAGQSRSMMTRAAASSPRIVIEFAPTGSPVIDALLKAMRYEIRGRFGGDVQRALGRGTAA